MFLSMILALGFSVASAQEEATPKTLEQLQEARKLELRGRIAEMVEQEKGLLEVCDSAKDAFVSHLSSSDPSDSSVQLEIKGVKVAIEQAQQVPGSENYIAQLQERLKHLEKTSQDATEIAVDGMADGRRTAQETGEKLLALREEIRIVEQALHVLIVPTQYQNNPFGAASTSRPLATSFVIANPRVPKLPSEFKVCFPHLVDKEATASVDN